MLGRLFARGIRKLDPDQLAPFERQVLEGIGDARHRTIPRIAMATQMRRMLAAHGGKVPGLPPWFDRRVEAPGHFVVGQQRPSGQPFGLPWTDETPLELAFPLTVDGAPGEARFLLRQYIGEMQLRLPASVASDYPSSVPDVSVATDQDDRGSWSARASTVSDLAPICQHVETILDAGRCGHEQVVFPLAPPPSVPDQLLGIRWAPSYRAFLSVMDGIRIGDWAIYGTGTGPRRLSEEAGRRWIELGSYSDGRVLLEVDDAGTMRDEVLLYEWSAGRERRTGRTVVDFVRERFDRQVS